MLCKSTEKRHRLSPSRAQVFLNASRCFPNREHKFYCPQLWVVRPTVMSYTTHSYGLYNPQLWVIKVMLMIWKTSAHDRENICPEERKHVRTFSHPGKAKKRKASFVFMNIRIAPNDKHNRHNRHKEYREMLNTACKEVHNSMPAASQRA